MATTSKSSNDATTPKKTAALRPAKIACGEAQLETLLTTEWLQTNRLGAYACSTVVGCNARRYHGLLVAATHPPVGRLVALSGLMEQVAIHGKIYDLATNEFADTIAPRGLVHLKEFRDDIAATFLYEVAGVKIIKRVLLDDHANAVSIDYDVQGEIEAMFFRPFTPMRDFHSLRSYVSNDPMHITPRDHGATVYDASWGENRPELHLASPQATFHLDPQWWYRVLYRFDVSRGQEGFEDLYSPGLLVWNPTTKKASCQIVASVNTPPEMDTQAVTQRRLARQGELLAPLTRAPRATRRLAVAADAFIVDRSTPHTPDGASITAGFPWFADWGRDTFIALPGLLLSTQQYPLARRVFTTYADHIDEGMIPNRFDDYAGPPHYNSIDASLWFVLAAWRYRQASHDTDFFQKTLLPACETIVNRYHDGTRFGIHAAADSLLWGGDADTQLTWMDAKLGDEAITARYGKTVEINALWYAAHRILAAGFARSDAEKAARYAAQADFIAMAFNQVFWNEKFGWLNDVVNDVGADASLRPNQIFAVSLPFSPLPADRQKAVLGAVETNLLTPVGLRTLSPADPRYRRRYGGSCESRERAYHQGTAWAWLLGPFIEAYLHVHAGENATTAAKKKARAQAKHYLAEFDTHLDKAGVGSVNEIFDGDKPHNPRGCFAQAWSVAEVLRAKCLVENSK